MKKLSVLIAMILCVTIGGVYATWTYAGQKVTDAKYESVIRLTDAVEEGAYGTYKVESNLKMFINQKSTGDYTAVLEYAKNNAEDTRDIFITVTFTPNSSLATPEIKANGLKSQLTFESLSPMQIKAREVTDADTGLKDIKGKWIIDETVQTATDILKFADPEPITWTKQDDGSFTYTLNETQIKERISLNKEFYLATKAEYDLFSAALTSNVAIRVSDIHPAAAI